MVVLMGGKEMKIQQALIYEGRSSWHNLGSIVVQPIREVRVDVTKTYLSGPV